MLVVLPVLDLPFPISITTLLIYPTQYIRKIIISPTQTRQRPLHQRFKILLLILRKQTIPNRFESFRNFLVFSAPHHILFAMSVKVLESVLFLLILEIQGFWGLRLQGVWGGLLPSLFWVTRQQYLVVSLLPVDTWTVEELIIVA
jgi:hypothetical protein